MIYDWFYCKMFGSWWGRHQKEVKNVFAFAIRNYSMSENCLKNIDIKSYACLY